MEESLANIYDVVINGTGLPESILAAACARSGKSVLHVDTNEYYGSDWAALSLKELETWAKAHQENGSDAFTSATLSIHDESSLGQARAYAIDLSPRILYAKSKLIDVLVSSRISRYLDFKSLPTTWVYQPEGNEECGLVKVPAGREDVFTSDKWDLLTKRRVMKFLKFAIDYDNEEIRRIWEGKSEQALPVFLAAPPFSLSPVLVSSITYAIALAASPEALCVQDALPLIHRHLTSLGIYGAFPTMVPMYGGGGELSQAFCRAAAVKGATYVLGKRTVSQNATEEGVEVAFDSGETVKCGTYVGSVSGLTGYEDSVTLRKVFVVKGDCKALVPTGDAAIVAFPPGTLGQHAQSVIAQIHGSGTGECPNGQWIWYLSTRGGPDAVDALNQASIVLKNEAIGSVAGEAAVTMDFLLELSYTERSPSPSGSSDKVSRIITLTPDLTTDYDAAVDCARFAYGRIFGTEEGFMQTLEEDLAGDEDGF
ncbi:Rab proteins geranylgeranyltransferase component A [Saitoella coloradoensis]